MTDEPQPPVGRVDFGHFRRRTPVSDQWGFDRGLPIDRYYIERFLTKHSADIAGDVLEVKDRTYTQRFGNDKVTNSEIVDISATNPQATIIADLTTGESIPSKRFHCVVLTQTLQLIFDVPAAVRTLRRILKPGGVLLATLPGISHLDSGPLRKAWYWKFTSSSTTRLFEPVFQDSNVEINSYGNVLASTAFLHGLAVEELSTEDLDFSDPRFELVITVRATTSGREDDDDDNER